jgi:hypothetical protein
MPATAPTTLCEADEIVLTSHPPERDRRFRRQPAQAGGCCCCCCCCCCLHSVGGLLGAALGASMFARPDEVEDHEPPRPTLDEDDRDEPSPRRTPREEGSLSGVTVFWLATLVGCILCAAGSGEGILILALGLPAIEFGAVILALLVVGFARLPDSGYQMRRVGGIALGAFLGTLIGILVMLPLFNMK